MLLSNPSREYYALAINYQLLPRYAHVTQRLVCLLRTCCLFYVIRSRWEISGRLDNWLSTSVITRGTFSKRKFKWTWNNNMILLIWLLNFFASGKLFVGFPFGIVLSKLGNSLFNLSIKMYDISVFFKPFGIRMWIVSYGCTYRGISRIIVFPVLKF